MTTNPETNPRTAELIDTEEKLIAHVNRLAPTKYAMALAMHQLMQQLNPPLWIKRVSDPEASYARDPDSSSCDH